MSSDGRSEIKVPALGESIQEATVMQWLKTVGDPVKMDEVLVELETDKVTLEVIAPSSGILDTIFVEKGGNVSVGDVLGLVVEAAEGVTSGKKPEIPQQKTQQPTVNTSSVKADGALAVEDIKSLRDGGAIVVEQSLLPHAVQASVHREERVKMSRLRQRIAERLKYAQNTAAILTTFNEVDMSAINAIRAEYKESFEKRHGVRLGVMSFFVKACVQALKEFPAVNSEIDGDEIIYKNYYDIGVAVSTPQGLVVPVVRNADILTFAELETTITFLAQKARDGKLSIEEMTGGTFTVSNGGVFGSLLATPILNPPQTGILGMHKIEDRPVAIQGKVDIRPMMYLALSYDHRVIDGRESVSFLVKVKESLENPERLLLDM